MEQHICTICGYAASIHPEECECGELHWPPLCCPGCDCGSFEEAHPELIERWRREANADAVRVSA